MPHPQRPKLSLLLLLAAFMLPGCTTLEISPHFASSQEFPVPTDLTPNVDFWHKVYARWSRSQVAVHDDRYLGVIYQVAELPGPIKASYTAQQRDFLATLQHSWRTRLTRLSRKLAADSPLTGEERALKNKLYAAGGANALIDPAERVRTQRGLRERFRRGLEISGQYDQRFRDIFRRHGVPEDLAYLPHVESSFQGHARSSVGAAGMWQFMPATGRHYMVVNARIDERLDPIIAADAAARYLADAHRQLSSWPLAITSYNHGVAGMNKARALHGDDIASIVMRYDGRAFGFASRNFYAEFIAARHVARHAHQYFPEGISYESPKAQRQVHLKQRRSIRDIAMQYQVPEHELIRLNPAWRNPIREGRTPVPAGSPIWLPGPQVPAPRDHQPDLNFPLFGARLERMTAET